MVAEMHKMRELLDDKKVAWWDESDTYVDRTVFEIDRVRWSVINGFGTYGGWRRDKHNDGLLELWDGNVETGWLTAEDAMKLIFNVEKLQ